MAKKKSSFLWIIIALLVVVIGLVIYFLIPKSEKKGDDSTAVEQQVSARYVLEMIDDDGVWLPRISGYVYADVVPEGINAVVFGEEEKIKITTIDYVDGQYRCGFIQEIEARITLYKGKSYSAVLYVVMPESGNVVKVNNVATLIADDDYTICSFIDIQGGESRTGYCKESEWLGPF